MRHLLDRNDQNFTGCRLIVVSDGDQLKATDGGLVVAAAMDADCDDCRAATMIGPTKAWPVRERALYEPEPMENADELVAEAIRRRDGY